MQIKRRDKEDNLYANLQQKSLQLLQELSGKRWTDYNEHDPGVTIMDIVNYALLELVYQTGFDFEKYLLSPQQEEVRFSKIGLLPAREIFASCIVTPQDYENLIITKVKGVDKCEVKPLPGNYYRIFIVIKEDAEYKTVLKAVQALYHSHRNLCENLEKIVYTKNLKKTENNLSKSSLQYNQQQEIIQVQNKFSNTHNSIQYDFPKAYGINQYGLPLQASEYQKTQVLQLKAYLLIFDYLLSGTKQQLSELHKTISLSAQVQSPFSTEINAQDLDLLVDLDKLKQTEVFKTKDLHKQKSTYLDMLDALYGEDTGFIAQDKTLSLEEVNKRRAKLIRQFPLLNTRRFCSFNLLDESLNSMPGIKRLMHTLWNNSQQREIPLLNLFGRYNLQLVSDAVFYEKKAPLFDMHYLADEFDTIQNQDHLTCIPRITSSPDSRKYETLKKHLHFFSHNLLFQGLLENGTHPQNYRMEKLDFQNQYLLLFKHPQRKRWLNIGTFVDKQVLIQTANLLWHFLEMLNTESTTFYIVEHLLLQSRTQPNEKENNVVSIILPAWRKVFFTESKYIETLQERLPIHIETYLVWLHADALYLFERHYYPWRKALAQGNTIQTQYHAQAIRQLLIKNK